MDRGGEWTASDVTPKIYTVNVEIFAQYIFSRISRRSLAARKYDVSEYINHYRLD